MATSTTPGREVPTIRQVGQVLAITAGSLDEADLTREQVQQKLIQKGGLVQQRLAHVFRDLVEPIPQRSVRFVMNVDFDSPLDVILDTVATSTGLHIEPGIQQGIRGDKPQELPPIDFYELIWFEQRMSIQRAWEVLMRITTTPASLRELAWLYRTNPAVLWHHSAVISLGSSKKDEQFKVHPCLVRTEAGGTVLRCESLEETKPLGRDIAFLVRA